MAFDSVTEQNLTFEIGADCLALPASPSWGEIEQASRRAWQKYGRQHFTETTLAALRLLAEKTPGSSNIVRFIDQALIESDRQEGARVEPSQHH